MASGQSEKPWPSVSPEERTLYENLFYSQGPVDGYILGEGVRDLLLKSGLSLTVLSQIWNLADVSNDNVLNVHEFVLAMHLIRGRMRGLTIPKTLPRCLTPPKTLPETPPPMSQQEKDAYLRVFQTLDFNRKGCIEACVAMEMLVSSKLPHDVIAHIWDLSDFDRDGKLSPEEFAIACHLVRYSNGGGTLSGPVDIFRYAPQHVSPISLLARKRRVAEYQEHKQRLMSLKERRRLQATRESRRFDSIKEKITYLQELVDLLQSLGRANEADETGINRVLAKDCDENAKQEEIVVRLKKEHEKVRQETVKIILREHKFTTDISLIKKDTDELNKRLGSTHSHATKDADPFHQLYEQRREKRQGSTIKDLDKIDIYIPFEFSPFDLEVTPETLQSGARILAERDSKGSNSVADLSSVIADVKGFGDTFMEEWGGLASSSSTASQMTSSEIGKEFQDDEIFMEVNEDYHDRWPAFDWSGDGLFGLTSEQVVKLKSKLGDLKEELTKLNVDHKRLVFRNPADYDARRLAKEEEEKAERGRINRRSTTERIRTNSIGSTTKPKAYITQRHSITDRPTSESSRAVREYRLKRRLESTSSSPEGYRNPDRLRRLTKSSAGSPSSISDEASLSRQSSLSSTDQHSSLRGSNPNLDQESTSRTQSSRTDDSGVLTLRSSRRKDNLSLELASVALGRHVQVELTAPPSSAPKSSQPVKADDSIKETIENIQPPDTAIKEEPIAQTSFQSEIENSPPKSQSIAPEAPSRYSAKKKSRAPQPPNPVTGNARALLPVQPAVSQNSPSQLADKSKIDITYKEERIPQPTNSNKVNTVPTTNIIAKTLTNQSVTQNEASPPIRPPRLKKRLGSTDSNSSKSQAPASPGTSESSNSDTKPRENLKREDSHNVVKIESKRSSTKKRPAPVPLDLNGIEENRMPIQSSADRKAKFILAPDSPQPISDVSIGITLEAKPAVAEESVNRVTQITQESAPPRSLPLPRTPTTAATTTYTTKPTMTSTTAILQSADSVAITEPSDSDTEIAIPPPLPDSAPPPLPMAAPPVIAATVGGINAVEEEISVEYSMNSPVQAQFKQKEISMSASAASISTTPSSTPPMNRCSSPPAETPASPVPTVSELRSNFFGLKSSAASSSSRSTNSDMKSISDDLTDSREPTSLDVYFNDLQTEVTLRSNPNGQTDESDDSDLSDTDIRIQKGRYDVFSPGDSGIMTSSIASTPDETDGNIELVNYTPYNDINTNNNYITTNFNYVNIDDNSYVNRNITNNNNNNIILNGGTANNNAADNIVNNLTLASRQQNLNSNGVSRTTTRYTVAADASPAPAITVVARAAAISSTPMEITSSFNSSLESSKSPRLESSKTPRCVVEDEVMISSSASLPSQSKPSRKSTYHDGVTGKNSSRGEIDSSSIPSWTEKSSQNIASSSRGQEIVEKARQFADMVQPRQKITIKLEKSEGEEFPQKDRANLLQERRDVINQAKVMRKTGAPEMPTSPKSEDEDLVRNGDRNVVSHNPSDYGFTYSAARDQPPPEVGWNEKSREGAAVNLYSENVVKEIDTTEQVDRESIANLSTTRKQWENIFSSAQNPEEVASKKKATPKWEVRLPAKTRGGTALSTDNGGIQTQEGSHRVLEQETKDMSGPRDMESAIEYEIRLAREREEMLKQEKEDRKQMVDKQSKSQGQSIIASYEAVSAESEAYQPAYHELAEADRGPDLWSAGNGSRREVSYNEVKTTTEEIDTNGSIDPNESIIEREIRLQRQREAELQKQRQILTPRQQPQPQQQQQQHQIQIQEQSRTEHFQQNSPVAAVEVNQQRFNNHHEEVPSDINHNEVADVTYEDAIAGAQHSGESIIAREMRELKDREEEIRNMRKSFQGAQIQQKETISSETPSPRPSSTISTPRPSQNQSSQSLTQQGTWQRDVSPFVSQKRRESLDSSSNHSAGRSSSDICTPSRNVKVQPIADGGENDEPDEKPNYFKKQETPIEREMRLSRERENELRRIKGLPEIVERKEDNFYAGVSASSESNMSPVSHTKQGSQQKQQSMKKYGANRLQQEVNAQKEREMTLRSEGKMISTSEEHIQPFKYREVTGSDRVDGSEKRNFTTKRSSVILSPSIVQEALNPQTPRDLSSPGIQKSSGSKKGIGSSGQAFSYKEFKQTAESKIEKELREMREREEELRNQRKTSTAETPR